MRKVSVSSTLTVFHDGQFWVGVIERSESGRLAVSKILFGAEPSNEEILCLVVEKWQEQFKNRLHKTFQCLVLNKRHHFDKNPRIVSEVR